MVDLASPLARLNLSLENRLAKAAMSERLAQRDGAPSEALIALYRRWASSGVSLLITGNVMIDAHARGEPGNVVIDSEHDRALLKRWASTAKSGGAKVFVQLNHPGRQAPRLLNHEVVAPSAIATRMAGMFARPRALGDQEIEQVIEHFAHSALYVKQAGFDGVQLHAAHGYLISQFLSPLANQRTDRWGGDATRRMHFLIATVRAVRAAVGPSFPISVKLNSADFQRGGLSENESMAVALQLEAEGIDLLEISGGTYEAAAMMGAVQRLRESSQTREGYFLEYAERVRRCTKLPLMLTGGFRTRVGMERALSSGAVDLVGLARPLALEPELGTRLLRDAGAQIVTPELRTGVAQVDGFLQTAWHGAQLTRLGKGEAPDRRLGKVRALLHYAGV